MGSQYICTTATELRIYKEKYQQVKPILDQLIEKEKLILAHKDSLQGKHLYIKFKQEAGKPLSVFCRICEEDVSCELSIEIC